MPVDLGRAVRHLDDESLDRLVKAAVAEARQRTGRYRGRRGHGASPPC